MTIWDDRILEYLRDAGGFSVRELANAEGIRVSQPLISRRCKKLAEHGLVSPLGNGVYVITDEGEAYLDEEYDAEEGTYLDAGEQDGPTAGGTEATE